MSTELEPVKPATVIVPGTGEVVTLENPVECARAVDSIRRLHNELRRVKELLVNVLAAEAQMQGTKTLHLPGADVRLTGGDKTVWDTEKLKTELTAAGLPAERLNAFLKPTVTYKPDGNVARQLAGANPEYARIIREAKRVEPAPWYAAVELRDPPDADVEIEVELTDE